MLAWLPDGVLAPDEDDPAAACSEEALTVGVDEGVFGTGSSRTYFHEFGTGGVTLYLQKNQ